MSDNDAIPTAVGTSFDDLPEELLTECLLAAIGKNDYLDVQMKSSQQMPSTEGVMALFLTNKRIKNTTDHIINESLTVRLKTDNITPRYLFREVKHYTFARVSFSHYSNMVYWNFAPEWVTDRDYMDWNEVGLHDIFIRDAFDIRDANAFNRGTRFTGYGKYLKLTRHSWRSSLQLLRVKCPGLRYLEVGMDVLEFFSVFCDIHGDASFSIAVHEFLSTTGRKHGRGLPDLIQNLFAELAMCTHYSDIKVCIVWKTFLEDRIRKHTAPNSAAFQFDPELTDELRKQLQERALGLIRLHYKPSEPNDVTKEVPPEEVPGLYKAPRPPQKVPKAIIAREYDPDIDDVETQDEAEDEGRESSRPVIH